MSLFAVVLLRINFRMGRYRKTPKFSDTQEIAVIILKFEYRNQRPMDHNAHLNVQLWRLYSAKILLMLPAIENSILFAMATNQIQQFGLNSYAQGTLL